MLFFKEILENYFKTKFIIKQKYIQSKLEATELKTL